MNPGSKEFYDLMDQFDRSGLGNRYDKEPKELWKKGRIYQNGETNALFKAYRTGYAFGKHMGETREH